MKNLLLSIEKNLNPPGKSPDFLSKSLVPPIMGFRKISLKKLLPARNLIQIVIFVLLFISGGIMKGYGQSFDGSYLPIAGAPGDEYLNAFTQIVDPNASSTCEIKQIWAKTIKDGGVCL